MEPLRPGDPHTIGAYRLLGRLGEGGMGQVYLARSERGRTVAVKTVQPQLAREADFRHRFAQEIAAARQIGGRWTAPVLDADTEAAMPWVATGYIAGPTLERVIARDHGPLPEHTVRALAAGLALALRDIHRTGLVHRDLKPSNVLVTIDGPRVIDFGIARALDGVTSGLTRTGAVIGSPGFMSPEQVRGDRLTEASDIFCLGSVLAYAASGHLPFGTDDSGAHALMFRIAESEPDLTGVLGELRKLIEPCLRKDPAQRPTVPQLLEHTGDASELQPWLPAEVLAQLGRHAVELLDSEDPESAGSAPTQSAPPRLPETPRPPHGRPRPYPGPGPQPGFPRPASPAGPWPGGPPRPAQGPHGPHTPHSRAPHPTGPYPAGPYPAAPVPGPGYRRPPRPHAVPPVQGPQPVRGMARALSWLFGGLLLLALGELVLYGRVLSELSSWPDEGGFSRYASDDLAELANVTETFSGVTSLLLLATVVLWLVWFWRVRRNAECFAPGYLRYPDGMAVGAWFIPGAMLVIPKQIANDIWRASARPPALHARGAMNAWWTLWVIQLLLGHVFLFWDGWTYAVTFEEAVLRTQWTLVSLVLAIPAALTAGLFVRRLSALQDQRTAELRR